MADRNSEPQHDLTRSIPPSVGIFWGIREGRARRLVFDRSDLAEAEPYGDALTHLRGHADLWEAWQKLGPDGLKRLGLPSAISVTEYDDHPRGRIVFQTKTGTFVLYADRRLQTGPFIARIRQAFGLEASPTLVQADSHYRARDG